MKVRTRLALTVWATGLLTALGVIATVVLAFAAFEHESAYDRANTFLGRVVRNHDNILEMQSRNPEEFDAWLRNLVLFETDTQLYLLDAEGRVLASTGQARLPPGFRVALEPVKTAAAVAEGGMRRPYVMGDDPERMDDDAVIAARSLRRAVIRATGPVDGYLYLVCHKPPLPPGRLEAFRSSFAKPALVLVAGVVSLATLFAWWATATVIRPLRRLSADVAQVARDGLGASPGEPGPEPGFAGGAFAPDAADGRADDEFGQLGRGFQSMLATLRQQWQTLRRLDHFRREGVSNLSHDLRSPLTATVACLETLEQRWAADDAGPTRGEDLRLVQVALRNTRNAARLVRSLGELAQLDEPEFQLRTETLDVDEWLGDIAMRFAQRAAGLGIELRCEPAQGAGALPALPPIAALDVELFERAVANLVDNALKFTPSGGRVVLSARVLAGGAGSRPWVRISVADTGPGISAADLPHLFDRFYQSRRTTAPASSDEGRGLGLAIVKRIVELHQGHVEVDSAPGQGTRVHLLVPSAGP